MYSTLLSVQASKKVIKRAWQIKELNGVAYDIREANDFIFGEVLSLSEFLQQNRLVFQFPAVCIDGTWFCTCTGYQTNKRVLCSHIAALLLEVGEKIGTPFLRAIIRRSLGEDVTIPQPRVLPTSMQAFNHHIGGLPFKMLVSLFGNYGVSKTILAANLAVETIQPLECNIFLLSTEGGYEHFLAAWAPRWNEKYNLDLQLVKVTFEQKVGSKITAPYEMICTPEKWRKTKPTIFWAYLPVIEDIVAFHGKQAVLKISETKVDSKTGEITGGKLTVKPISGGWVRRVGETPIAYFFEKHKVRCIVYDSVTHPLDDFVGGQEQLPARQQAAALWLKQAEQLIDRYDAMGIGTHHISRNPQQKYDRGKQKGGAAVGFNFKYVIRVRSASLQTGQRYKDGIRKMDCERHYFKKEWSGVTQLQLDDTGFHDAAVWIEGED